MCTAETIYWNPTRLAAAWAVGCGLNPFAPQSSAAQLGWIYGPVYALVYAPLAAIPNLSIAMMAAALVNVAIIAFPAAILAWITWRRWSVVALAGLASLALALAFAETFLWIHVDAIAIGLAAAAVGALVVARQTDRGVWVVAGAVAAALAPWTKQLAIVVPATLAVWLWWNGDRRRAVFFSAVVALVIVALAVGFSAWFGFDALWFSMVTRPGHTPYSGETLIDSLRRLFVLGGLWSVLALLIVGLARKHRSSAPLPVVTALVWLAVSSIPLGVMACAKLGGGPNSIHGIGYLTIGLALVASRIWSDHPVARSALAALLVLGAARGLQDHLTRGVYWAPTFYQANELAWAASRPGHVYYPWNPLITIVTDRKIYPTEDALYHQRIANLRSPAEALAAAVPSDAIVVYHDPEPRGNAVSELRNARQAIRGRKPTQ